MKANELRIGNYIADIWTPNGLFKVTELRKDKIFYGNCFKGKYDDIRPIPLTEEILLKAGFEKDTGEFYIYKDITVRKTYYSDDFWRFIFKHQRIKDIKYLHDLQNTIFALTGEEIKIEL